MRIVAHVFWLLCNFSDQCEDLRLGDGQIFLIRPLFLRSFLECEVLQLWNCHVVAEKTIYSSYWVCDMTFYDVEMSMKHFTFVLNR